MAQWISTVSHEPPDLNATMAATNMITIWILTVVGEFLMNPSFNSLQKKLDKTSQPFLSVFFSLSAHHPYTIPNQYKGQFRKGNLQIQEAIMYSDYSLKRFFDTAKQWSGIKTHFLL